MHFINISIIPKRKTKTEKRKIKINECNKCSGINFVKKNEGVRVVHFYLMKQFEYNLIIWERYFYDFYRFREENNEKKN